MATMRCENSEVQTHGERPVGLCRKLQVWWTGTPFPCRTRKKILDPDDDDEQQSTSVMLKPNKPETTQKRMKTI
jgi:hypothetical protein